MSTSYYRLPPPITHLRVEDVNPTHTRLSVWIDHGLSGTLVIPTTAFRDVLRLFTKYEDDFHCPLRTHWGGGERKSIVTVNDPDLPDEAIVISEYGELLTVAQVKARDGIGRSDGMPTELFGYE